VSSNNFCKQFFELVAVMLLKKTEQTSKRRTVCDVDVKCHRNVLFVTCGVFINFEGFLKHEMSSRVASRSGRLVRSRMCLPMKIASNGITCICKS
jgi:hypothetical protein